MVIEWFQANACLLYTSDRSKRVVPGKRHGDRDWPVHPPTLPPFRAERDQGRSASENRGFRHEAIDAGSPARGRNDDSIWSAGKTPLSREKIHRTLPRPPQEGAGTYVPEGWKRADPDRSRGRFQRRGGCTSHWAGIWAGKHRWNTTAQRNCRPCFDAYQMCIRDRRYRSYTLQ